MDPSLLRERELFKKRALAVPTVEKRKSKDDGSSKPAKKTKTQPKQKASSGSSSYDYKTMAGSSQYKFAILAKIVKYMKQRHQDGDAHPLTIEEILDETNQLDVGARHKHWLATEALLNNPKIEVVDGNTYKFRPKYNVRDRKSLMRLLDKHDTKGYGGILQEDIEESLPHAQKAFKSLEERIIFVTRPNDKKTILFYNDKSYHFTVDEELQKLWRASTVDGVDEGKIEDYLEKQGIASMQDIGTRKVPIPKRKKGGNKKRKATFKSHNEHVSDVLEDYSDAKK